MQRQTLVLVHGFMGGSAQWNCVRPHLEPVVDLVALDLPGFGQNSHLPPLDRIEAFADWAIAEVKGRGVERYALLGHSMGGMIAQEIARRDQHAIRKLVLYATGAVGVIPGRFETIYESKRRAAADGAEATARRISATWFLDWEHSGRYPDCAAVAARAGLPAILAGLDAMQAWSGEDQLVGIPHETLILWGDRDRTYSWDQT